MSRLTIVSIWALVTSACAATGALGGEPATGLAWGALVAGVLGLAVAGVRDPAAPASVSTASPGRSLRRFAVVLAVVCAGLALLVPGVGAAALVVLAVGLALLGLGTPRLASIGQGVAVAGTLLALLALGVALWFREGADAHEAPFLAGPVAAVLRGLGLPAHALAGDIVVPEETRVFRAIPDLAAFGLVPGLLLLAALGAHEALNRRTSAARFVAQSALLLLALFVRYVTLLVLVLSAGSDRAFWSPWVLAATLLPVAWLLAAVPRGDEVVAPVRAPSRGFRVGAGAAAVGALLVAFGATAYSAGERKPGRVLIDEGHSRWERTDVTLDTETYGQHTTYTYTTLARWLRHFYDVSTSEAPLTDAALAEVDVLVLKVPTAAYGAEERDAVTRFVERGGGLFLVGDHTNVFGSTDRLNPLAERFGMHFVHDAQYDLRTGGLTRWTPPALGAHPVARSVPSFLFATGCTLRLTWPARPIQTGSGMRTFPADYSRDSFFCEQGKYHTSPAGLFHQSAAAEYGRGRVVAFTDSTVWSNFFVFVPGKPELALAMIEWLNHREPTSGWRGALVALGLALLGGGLLVARGHGSPTTRVVIGGALSVAVATGVLLGDATASRAAGLPAPRSAIPSPRFIANDADFFLPSDALISDGPPAYTQFFNLSQRLGLFPRVDADWSDVLSSRMAIWIRPRAVPPAHECGAVREWIAGGGHLLVLADGPDGAVTGRFLRELGSGLRLERSALPTDEEADPVPLRLAAAFRANLATPHRSLERAAAAFDGAALRLEGGEPWLWRGADEAVIASETLGQGRVTAIAAAEAFANDALGHSELAPDPTQRELFELTFALFRVAYDLAPAE